jgi:GNAT superfamily N-acetyltransferase
MVIREAKEMDAASIARVVVDTWRTTYTGIVPQDYLDSLSYEKATSRWQERLSDMAKLWPGWFTYVVEDDNGEVIGFAGGGPSQGYGLPFSGELGFIYLLKSHQRQGIGRQMAATVALRLKKQGHNSMLVWVFSANPYRAFYEALGGRPVAEREIDRYGANLAETAYGWQDLEIFEKIQKSDLTF